MTLFSLTRSATSEPACAVSAKGDEMPTVANEVPTDSFAAGISSIIGLSAIQKVVGLLRTVIFFRLLSDDQMGRWSLIALFLAMAAPLTVFGLPGTFGKYVEYFRQRGQLRAFLRRTTGICAVLTSLAVLGMIVVPVQLLAVLENMATAVASMSAKIGVPVQFSHEVFRDVGQSPFMVPVALVLLSTIIWNYLSELLTALRMIRITSLLQFVNAISFTICGTALVVVGYKTELSIILAFGISNLLSLSGALWVLVPASRELKGPDHSLQTSDVWSKLLPYAAWVWQSNLLANSFMASSPFMIKLCVELDPLSVDKMVGQFSSSRAVPMIFVTVAVGIGTTVLPYLSHDWELGRRNEVSRRMNLTLKMLALAFSLAGAGLLLAAPILFGIVLNGRYDAGLSLLPYTLTYCVWFSLIAVSQNFLWCVERAWLGCCALLAGLLTNIALSYFLLPIYGLNGSVWAVTAASLVTLFLMYGFSSLNGLRIDRGTWIATLVPLVIGYGGNWGAALVVIGAVGSWKGNLLLSNDERQSVVDAVHAIWKRIPGSRGAGTIAAK